MKIIGDNECELNCKCGWNITIGGTDKKEYEILKRMFEDKEPWPSTWTDGTGSTDYGSSATYTKACTGGACNNECRSG